MNQSVLDMPPPEPSAQIAYGPDPNQFGHLRLPAGEGPHPVIVFLHGGFWRAAYNLTHAGYACAALTRAGFATWNLEYRRLAQPGGGWPGTMDDVRRGLHYLQTIARLYDLDLARVIAAGHSAGGQLALWLAAQQETNLLGVVALAAVSDLRLACSLRLSDGVVTKYLGGTPEQVPDRYALSSPLDLLPLWAPQRLLHGTSDDDVPFEMSRHFAQTSENARLIPLDGAGHYELIDPRSRQWPIVERNFMELVPGSSFGVHR